MSETGNSVRLGAYSFSVTILSLNLLGWWEGIIAALLIVAAVNVLSLAFE